MMRKYIIVVFIITLTLLTAKNAAALTDDDVMREQAQSLEFEQLENAVSEDTREILGDIGVMDGLDASGAIGRIFTSGLEKFSGILKSGLRDAALIVMIAVLCTVVTGAFGANSADYVALAGVLAIAAVSVTSVNSFMGLSRVALEEMDSFSKMLLPTLASAAASAGAVTSAAAKYAATAFFMNIMITLSKNVIMPLIFAYIAVSIAEAAAGGDGLAAAGGLIKWFAKSALIVVDIAFIAYLSISGVISGSTDAVTVRAAKTAIQTVLPVVGSIIADASDTVLAGASILRNAVGVFGMLAVLAICLTPFMRLGASYLLYKAAGGISASIADKRVGKLINAVSAAFGLTLGMTGSMALMMYISIISAMKVFL